MWVYIESERFKDEEGAVHILYTVGFYSPDGKWHPDSDWGTQKEAGDRVNYLNGGRSPETAKAGAA